MIKLARFRKTAEKYCTDPVVNLLAKTGVTPNALTWFGFLISVVTAVLAALGHMLAAGLVVLFGSYFDMLDGSLARKTGKVSRFGEVLDSTLDRLSEGFLLLGLLYWVSVQDATLGIMLAGITLLSSLVVSYIRAKAEIMKLECTEGLFTRPERVIVLAIGLLVNQVIIALAIVAALSVFTVGQRLHHVWRQLK